MLSLLSTGSGLLFGGDANGRFRAVTANPAAYAAVFAIFAVSAITISVNISNRQDAQRRALKRPIANACVGLYGLSLEVQRFLSTLQFVSHNDLNGRSVDLAALRDAVAAAGGDPLSVNPKIPVDFVIDHSIVADFAGSADAARKNIEVEYARNRERFAFLAWCQGAFRNLRVVPPDSALIRLDS